MLTTRGDATERAARLIWKSQHTSGAHARAPRRDFGPKASRSGSLVFQPGLGGADLAEDLGRRKVTGREHLEDLRRAEPGVRPDDDGARPEPNAVPKPDNLFRHGSQLLARGQRGRVGQVQDDIEPSRALLVDLQLAKMSNHLRERDVPETTGANEAEAFIDRVRNGHSSPLSRWKVTTLRGALRALRKFRLRHGRSKDPLGDGRGRLPQPCLRRNLPPRMRAGVRFDEDAPDEIDQVGREDPAVAVHHVSGGADHPEGVALADRFQAREEGPAVGSGRFSRGRSLRALSRQQGDERGGLAVVDRIERKLAGAILRARTERVAPRSRWRRNGCRQTVRPELLIVAHRGYGRGARAAVSH